MEIFFAYNQITKPFNQPDTNIHTYSSLTCNVTNYDEMLKYNYSDTKFNIGISVDGKYIISEIFQFKLTGFLNEMYIDIVAVVIFLELIYFTVKTQIENYIEERRDRKTFISISTAQKSDVHIKDSVHTNNKILVISTNILIFSTRLQELKESIDGLANLVQSSPLQCFFARTDKSL
ncbi:hypothetical protein ACTFIU_011285 [Dictyostelium citrinum]